MTCVIIVALACVLAAVWVAGIMSHPETYKYVAMLLCASVTLAGVSCRQAPAPWVRVVSVAVILVATIFVALFPWIAYGYGLNAWGKAWESCDQHCYRIGGDCDGTGILRPGLLDVCFVVFITPVAMACAAVWHQPSYFARGAVLCVIIIWLMKLGWILEGYRKWCGNPPFSGEKNGLYGEILFGYSMGLLVISLGMTNLLIVLRIKALEKSLGQKRSGTIICVVVMYCLTYIVNDLFSNPDRSGAVDILRHVRIPVLKSGHASWFDLALPFFPLATSVLIGRVFALPLRVLGEEAKRLRGAPQAQASWSVQTLRRERAGALCMTIMALVKLCYQPWAYGLKRMGEDILTIVSSLSDMANLVGTAVMCGVLRQSDPPAPPSRPSIDAAASETAGEPDPAWQRKVQRLAGRGFTLAALLDFLELLFERQVMPSFSQSSTTNDVVRQAIIPLSRGAVGGYALATVWNAGRSVLPQRMVTHNWENAFLNLVAGIVADGLGHDTYQHTAESLLDVHGARRLRRELSARGTLTRTYWVCALSVNQHASICGSYGPLPPEGSPEFLEWMAKRHDSVTGQEMPVCTCSEQKFFSSSPVECEMNKFDDMMAYLFREVPGFCQLVAVDTSFRLFTRAWCVAELAEADAKGMSQTVKIYSEGSLEAHFHELSLLDVRECRASRAEDRDFILQKVGDISIFNARLQWLVFGAEGLFKSWANYRDRAATIGKITRRALSRMQRESSVAVGLV